MSDQTPSGGRTRLSLDGRAVTAVVLAAAASVAFIQWLPPLVLFFPVPLFVMYFISAKPVYVASVILAAAFDAAASCVMLAGTGTADGYAYLLVSVQAALVFLPLLILCVPGKLGTRYRVCLVGITAATGWLAFLALTGTGQTMLVMVREITDATANAIYGFVADGADRDAIRAQFSPDSLYSMTVRVFSCTLYPLFILVHAAAFLFANGLSAFSRRSRKAVFRAARFYNDRPMFAPLVCGMGGIMVCRVLRAPAAEAVFWNLFVTAGLFFALQGYGILRAYLDWRRQRLRAWFILEVAVLVFLVLQFWYILICVLSIAGVTELFVPIRARFINKDIADPTPGNGNDHY